MCYDSLTGKAVDVVSLAGEGDAWACVSCVWNAEVASAVDVVVAAVSSDVVEVVAVEVASASAAGVDVNGVGPATR